MIFANNYRVKKVSFGWVIGKVTFLSPPEVLSIGLQECVEHSSTMWLSVLEILRAIVVSPVEEIAKYYFGLNNSTLQKL